MQRGPVVLVLREKNVTAPSGSAHERRVDAVQGAAGPQRSLRDDGANLGLVNPTRLLSATRFMSRTRRRDPELE